MNLNTALILAAGVALVAVLAIARPTMQGAAGPHAEFSEHCEKNLTAVAEWAIREMERQGHPGTYAQRTAIMERIPLACACAGDRLGPVIADDKWALAGQLAGIKYEVELAARTQNASVRTHTEDEARATLKRLMSDNKMSMTELAALSQSVDGTLKACFRRHFSAN